MGSEPDMQSSRVNSIYNLDATFPADRNTIHQFDMRYNIVCGFCKIYSQTLYIQAYENLNTSLSLSFQNDTKRRTYRKRM